MLSQTHTACEVPMIVYLPFAAFFVNYVTLSLPVARPLVRIIALCNLTLLTAHAYLHSFPPVLLGIVALDIVPILLFFSLRALLAWRNEISEQLEHDLSSPDRNVDTLLPNDELSQIEKASNYKLTFLSCSLDGTQTPTRLKRAWSPLPTVSTAEMTRLHRDLDVA